MTLDFVYFQFHFQLWCENVDPLKLPSARVSGSTFGGFVFFFLRIEEAPAEFGLDHYEGPFEVMTDFACYYQWSLEIVYSTNMNLNSGWTHSQLSTPFPFNAKKGFWNRRRSRTRVPTIGL